MQVTKASFTDQAMSTNNTFTAASEFPTQAPLTAPAGSVVINEIMWMGSNFEASPSTDEWIELKNMTDNTYNLTNWTLIGAGNVDIKILSGTLPPNGYFLISKRASNSSVLNITPDYVSPNVQLDNSNLKIFLANSANDIVDVADDGVGLPLKGTNESNQAKRSMERKDPPGNGMNPIFWHSSNGQTNLDSGAVDFATPKASNSAGL